MTKKVKVEVFTSPSCPYCPAALELVRGLKGELGGLIELQEVDVSEELGRTKAIGYGIRSVPAIVLDSRQTFVGVPKKEELAAAIKGLSAKER